MRGVALLGGKPDLKLGLTYDRDGGLYAGATLIAARRANGYIVDVGYAGRAAAGLSWDVGAMASGVRSDFEVTATATAAGGLAYPVRYRRRYRADYVEAYAGFSSQHFSSHLYFSPRYYGRGSKSVYVDFNAAIKPAPRLRLFWHAGLLEPIGGDYGPARVRERADLRAGAAVQFDHGEVQLAWTAIDPAARSPNGEPQDRSALVASATVFF